MGTMCPEPLTVTNVTPLYLSTYPPTYKHHYTPIYNAFDQFS